MDEAGAYEALDEDFDAEDILEEMEPAGWRERIPDIARATAEYTLAVVAGLLPVFVIPFVVDAFTQPKATLAGVAATILVAAWLAEGIAHGRLRFPKTPVDLSLLAFYGLLALATLFSQNFGLSLFGPYKWREGLVYTVCYGVIFYAAAAYLTGPALRRALWCGGAGAAVVSLYAIAQRLGFDFTTWFGPYDPTRAFSTLGNPVYLGAYTTLVVPVAAAYAIAAPKESRERLAAGAVAVLTAIAAATSFSRAAWVGLVAAFVVIAVASPRRRQVAGWIVAILVVGLIAAAIPVAGQAQDFPSRLRSIFTVGRTNAARVALWNGALTLVERHPWLGVGPEAFRQEFAQVKPENWAQLDPEDKSGRAHSDVLNVAATAGVPAALAYLAVWLILIGRGLWLLLTPAGREAAFGSPDGHEGRRTLISGFVGAAVAYFLFLTVTFTMVEVTPVFWVLAGALVAGTRALGTGAVARDWRLPAQLEDRTFFWTAAGTIALAGLWLISVFFRQQVADYYFARALNAETTGRLVAGIGDLQSAIALSPREDYYYFFLGKAYVMAAQDTGDPRILGLGETAYEKALTLNRADTVLLNALGSAYYIGATRFGRTDDFARSEFYYKKTLTYDRNNPDALERLGQIAFRQGQYSLAVSYFQQAVGLLPDNSAYHYNLALGYENMGEPAKALKELERTIRLSPDDSQAKEALASLKKRLGATPVPKKK